MRWYSVSRFLIAFDLEHCNNQFDLILKARRIILNEQLELHMQVSVCVRIDIHWAFMPFIFTLETGFPPCFQSALLFISMKTIKSCSIFVLFASIISNCIQIAHRWLNPDRGAANHIRKPKRKSVGNFQLNVGIFQCNIHGITPSTNLHYIHGQNVWC